MDIPLVIQAAFVLSTNVAADAAPAVQIGAILQHHWLWVGLEARVVLPSVAHAAEATDPRWPFEPQDFDLSQWTFVPVMCMPFAKYFSGCLTGQIGFHMLQTRTETDLSWVSYVGPRLAVQVPFAERVAVFGFAEAFSGIGPGLSISAEGPNGEPSPNASWWPPLLSAFAGAGLAVDLY